MTPLLIEAQRLKQLSTINGNLDNKLIEPTIIMVQDIQLQSILGTDLYVEICNEVEGGNVSALNTSLLNNFIEPYLLNIVVAEGVIDWHIKFSNKSVSKLTADNTQNVDLTELERVSQRYLGKAEFYATRLSKYLCENSENYPLYMGGNSETWKIRPMFDQYTSGIFTGSKRVDPRREFAGFRSRRRRW